MLVPPAVDYVIESCQDVNKYPSIVCVVEPVYCTSVSVQIIRDSYIHRLERIERIELNNS